MSILDTFFILFDSDASKLNKGLDETDRRAKKTTQEIKSLDDAAYKMGQSFGNSLKQLGGALLAGLTLRAMSAALMEATDKADSLGEATGRLGLEIEAVSAWGDIIKKNGGSVEGFIGSIDGLNNVLSMMEVTGKSRAAPFLKELGIDLDNVAYKGKGAMELLLPIAEAMEGMDKQKSSAIGRKLGLDPATIYTLQSGRKAVEELIAKEKELGVITKQQAEIAGKFNDQIDDMHHAFRSLWLTVGQSVLPVLTWLAEKFQNVALFMRKHSDFIVGLMIALGAAILYFVIPPLFTMAAAVLIAFAPFLIAGAIVAALAAAFALLYDDVMNFLDGNDSLIGQMLEKWPMLGEAINAIIDIVKGLGSAVAWTFETMVSVLQIAWDVWSRGIMTVLEFTGHMGALRLIASAIGAAFSGMGSILGAVWDGLSAKVRAFLALVSSAINLVKGVAGAITGALGGAKVALGISTPVAEGVAAGRATLGAAAASPINAAGGASNRSTSVTVGKVDVYTQATDAAGISKAIGGTMETQMRQAANSYDDGVAA